MSIENQFPTGTCGCCQALVDPTPELIHNRPGLTAIAYRVGAWASFRQAMLQSIAGKSELRAWTTRSSDDYGIALLEMWAYVADILTFYQERIANEAFLRTALHRESVLRLAALLDYIPAPGMAAVTRLAFEVAQHKQVHIPMGLRVQSVPGQDEKPQKFETVEEITAVDALNTVPIFPRPQYYDPFAMGRTSGQITASPEKLVERDEVVVFDAVETEFKTVRSINASIPYPNLNWTPSIQYSRFILFTTRMALCRQQHRLFGYNAPEMYMQPKTDGADGIQWTEEETDFSLPQQYIVPFQLNEELPLEKTVKSIQAGDRVLIIQQGYSEEAPNGFARMAKVREVNLRAADPVGPSQETVTHLGLDLAVKEGPVVVTDDDGCLNAFVIGDDQALWTIKRTAPDGYGTWGTWTSLGGTIDMLAVGKNTDGCLEVFARGKNDKALWHIRQTVSGSGWGAWQREDIRIDGLLSMGQNRDGRPEVFFYLKSRGLMHIQQMAPNGIWSQPQRLGGFGIDLLAVSRDNEGRLVVFVRDKNRFLLHIRQTSPGDVWESWQREEFKIDRLAVGQNQDGRLEVFVRGLDKNLWHMWQLPHTGEWSGPRRLGSRNIKHFAVGRSEEGQLEAFAIGQDQNLWRIRQENPNDTLWTDWQNVITAPKNCDQVAICTDVSENPAVLLRTQEKKLAFVSRKLLFGSFIYDTDYLGVPMWDISDRRQIMVYALDETLITLWNRSYTQTILGDGIFIPIEEKIPLTTGRNLLLDDKETAPHYATVVSTQNMDLDGDGRDDHQVVVIDPSLDRSLATATAVLYGNVAKATHGETIEDEILGSGDTSSTFQSFEIKKSPVTYVPEPGQPNGAGNTLRVRVGGVQWERVRSFYGRLLDARIFTCALDNQGKTTIRFGDGVNGARLPSGRDNIRATYRHGLGSNGNVNARTLTTLLDRPVGLKKAFNPGPARGGAEPESISKARSNAPNTVRTFGRIVSLRDFEDVAREYAGVAKARATWVWNGIQQAVHLTVAGDDGAAVIDEMYTNLVKDLNARRHPHRKLTVARTYGRVAVQVSAVLLTDPNHLPATVQHAAVQALQTYFDFDRLDLGQSIHLSGVFNILQQVAGVTAVDINRLQYKNETHRVDHGVTTDAVQKHLPIYGARITCTASGTVAPAEMAIVETPVEDLDITTQEARP